MFTSTALNFTRKQFIIYSVLNRTSFKMRPWTNIDITYFLLKTVFETYSHVLGKSNQNRAKFCYLSKVIQGLVWKSNLCLHQKYVSGIHFTTCHSLYMLLFQFLDCIAIKAHHTCLLKLCWPPTPVSPGDGSKSLTVHQPKVSDIFWHFRNNPGTSQISLNFDDFFFSLRLSNGGKDGS